MPSPDTLARLAQAGRRGIRMRWARATQAEKDASAALAREGMKRIYLEEAEATFNRLGVTPTPEQIWASAVSLHRADLSDRLVLAREAAAKSTAELKRQADVNWATEEAAAYATLLHVVDPVVPDSACLRICLMAAREELDAPDGFNPTRLGRRLWLLVQSARENVAAGGLL